MGGKASILLVLGFSLIFMVIGHNFGSLTNRGIDNFTDYYIRTNAHNLAVSGANMAANEVFMNKTWDAGYSSLTIGGGTVNVYVSNPNYGLSGKVTICHIPPGNSLFSHDLSVPAADVPGHIAHGDNMGTCSGNPLDSNMVTIVSEATYEGFSSVVIVELRPSYFSKFGNYYTTVTAMPATGDTFNGPFHTQGKMYTWGSPVFWGKVTSRNGLALYGTQDPKFYGGYEDGVDIPLEFDTTGFRANAGRVFYDTTGTNQTTDVKLYFNADGTVDWSQKIGAGPWSSSVNTPLSTLTNTGLIYVEKGNIYTSGTVNGAATIVATKGGLSGAGQIFQEDDIVYNDDPRTNPNSTDVLGMVAEDKIRLVYDAVKTKGQDIITQASMFSLTSDIGPEDALIDDPSLNSWKILGGLIANTTRVTARYNSTGPYKGYKFVHTYDERFMTYVPPHFPHTKDYEVVSWFE